MKTDIRKIMIIAAALVLGAVDAFANNEAKEDWKEKIQSEKIAFLTLEIGLTPQEAQVFWPVYNEINEEKDKAMYEAFA